MNADDHATQQSLRQLHGLCDQFEQAWTGGSGPDVQHFLESVGDQWSQSDPAVRRRLLEELIKLDLEFRWQAQRQDNPTDAGGEQETVVGIVSDPKRLLLEDYLNQHTELGSSDRLSLELVVEEYRVRQRWGDQPPHQEYLTRFPDHGPQLQNQLVRVDEELSAENKTLHRGSGQAGRVLGSALTKGEFGDYELLEEIARGGMGVVYKARQVSLNRIVALKMILSGQLASEEEVTRFQTEAESAAGLNHPNIVTIHEVGEEKGKHFFSMDYIDGQNLADMVHDHPLPARQAASYLQEISEAIEYAHQQGTLHRDLKPSNIIVNSAGVPRITDFGLAKSMKNAGNLTGTGEVLGTPAYMPPEQASGDQARFGPAMDVYSLGAILYELLTGRPPFQSESTLDLILQVLEKEPVTPRLLNPNIPRDLQTICLKCLAKDPQRRYASATALASDLDRWLNGQSIEARPISSMERGWRWCRRRPAVAGLSLAVLVAMIVGTTVSIYYGSKAKDQASAASLAAQRAKIGEEDAREEETRAKLAELEVENNLYVTKLFLAKQYQQEGRSRDALDVLEKSKPTLHYPDRRSFEWYYLQRQIRSQFFTLSGLHDSFRSLACSPDGTMIASAGDDSAITIWDVDQRQVSFTLPGNSKSIHCVTFGPLPGQLASTSSDGTILLWNLESREVIQRFVGHDEKKTVSRLRFNPQGTRLVSASDDKTAKVWDLETGDCLLTLKGHRLQVKDARYSPNGETIVTVSLDRADACLWDAETGKKIVTLTKKGIDRLDTAAFSPDGRHLLVGSRDGWIHAWDLQSQEFQESYQVHTGRIPEIEFGPDGRWFASVGAGMEVSFWDFPGGQLRSDLKVPGIRTMSLLPHGNVIATAGSGSSVTVWPTGRVDAKTLLGGDAEMRGHTEPINDVVISPDGKFLVTGSWDDTVRIWDRVSGKSITTLKVPAEPRKPIRDCRSVAFSPDGKVLVSVYQSGRIAVWDPAKWGSEDEQKPVLVRAPNVYWLDVTFSPDSKYFVTSGRSGQVYVWETATREFRRKLKHAPSTSTKKNNEIRATAFSPDGNWLLTGGVSGEIQRWSTKTWKLANTLKVQHEQGIQSLAFSSDGNWFASASDDKVVILWETAQWDAKHVCKGHLGSVYDVVFTPDGKRIVSGSADRTIKVWDVITGQEVMTLAGHQQQVRSIAIDPTGQFILSGSMDQTARFWNAAPLPNESAK